MCLAENANSKVGHGKLGDLLTRSVHPWLPDGMAELLDDVIGEVSEYIQSRHHLVIVEGFRQSLAEEKDTLEHVNCGREDPCLKGSRFLMQVIFIFIFVLGLVSLLTDGLFIRVNAPVTSSLLMSFEGFKLSARHQPFIKGLWVLSGGISFPSPGRRHQWSSHCRRSSQVRSEDVSCQSFDCATVIVGQWSMIRGPCRQLRGSLANVSLMN
jgi:hypothetical protein